ncbi:MAG: Y-family DNA polymerase [Prevotella sp.]|jgi:DNA polymerase V
MAMYLLVDVDSAFCEFERKRRPELVGKPVVVTAGEAAVVAISKEAKALGIKRGEPIFKLKQRIPNLSDVVFLPADHHWYKQASDELMDFLRQEAPKFWQYSIDEAFMDMSDVKVNLKEWGEQLYQKVRDYVHVSVSIGVAPTKTLAKIASHFAKKYPGYHHCCVIDTDERREKALKLTEIKDVWGIGRRHQAKLVAKGIATAADLVHSSPDLLRLEGFPSPLIATREELCGIDCIPMRDPGPKKSMASTQTFAKMTSSYEDLVSYISLFAADCAEGLRAQHSVARDLSVFIATNPYRTDLPQYEKTIHLRLSVPTNLTDELSAAALSLLHQIFVPGYRYKRAGVTVYNLQSETGVQTSLFDFNAERHDKSRKVNKAVDEINKQMGTNVVRLGNQVQS